MMLRIRRPKQIFLFDMKHYFVWNLKILKGSFKIGAFHSLKGHNKQKISRNFHDKNRILTNGVGDFKRVPYGPDAILCATVYDRSVQLRSLSIRLFVLASSNSIQ